MFGASLCSTLFSETVVATLKEQGGIVEYATDISLLVHHGLHFLCDMCVYYPTLFFPSLFDVSVKLTIEVINLSWDVDAFIAVGHFYDDVESIISSDSTCLESIAQTMEANGSGLVHSLFYYFMLKCDPTAEIPAQRVVDFVFKLCPVSAISWLQQVLSGLPEGSASDEEKMVFAGQVFKLMSSNRFRGIGHEMNEFVKAYSARNYTPR